MDEWKTQVESPESVNCIQQHVFFIIKQSQSPNIKRQMIHNSLSFEEEGNELINNTSEDQIHRMLFGGNSVYTEDYSLFRVINGKKNTLSYLDKKNPLDSLVKTPSRYLR